MLAPPRALVSREAVYQRLYVISVALIFLEDKLDDLLSSYREREPWICLFEKERNNGNIGQYMKPSPLCPNMRTSNCGE
jgi:hypothetical protein